MMDKDKLMSKIAEMFGDSDEGSEPGEGRKCPHCGGDLED